MASIGKPKGRRFTREPSGGGAGTPLMPELSARERRAWDASLALCMESSTFDREGCEPYDVPSVPRRLRRTLTALPIAPMLKRMLRAMKYAAKEENFAVVAGAAVTLILVGTVTYSLGEGWNVVDGFYFAVCTLTTSSIADPDLTLTHDALKIFTVIYVLTGIGILVELARRLGVGFVREREGARKTRQAPQGRPARDTVGGIARIRRAAGVGRFVSRT